MSQLSRMNNDALEASLEIHISNERNTLHIILDHIREVAKRELHLARGFPDVKRYLMKRYGYSEPAARRRMEAANILKDVPELVEKIQDGSICLTVIGELTRAIKEKENVSREKVSAAQKTELVAMISGKSVPESQQQLAQALDIKIRDYEHQRVQRDESVRLEFTVSKELYEKLNQCRDLSAHQLQQEHKNQTLASVIEVLADLYLKTKTGVAVNSTKPVKTSRQTNSSKSFDSTDSTDSTRRLDSSASAASAASTSTSTSTSAPTSSGQEDKILQPAGALKKPNKTLTPKTKREVLARDKGCQFKDPKTDQVCGHTFALQTDHKTSQWAGGNHDLKNLQALCANHNRHKYRTEAQLRWI